MDARDVRIRIGLLVSIGVSPTAYFWGTYPALGWQMVIAMGGMYLAVFGLMLAVREVFPGVNNNGEQRGSWA